MFSGAGTVAGIVRRCVLRRIGGQNVSLAAAGSVTVDNCATICGTSDNGMIVIDEVVGLWIAMWGLPFTFQTAVLGFILFRLFDVVKPFPVRWIEQRVPGGWGVMLDDVSAGIYTQISLRVILMMAGS